MSRRSEQVSLFSAFHKAGVEYAIVGGVAVNAYGFVRATRDLDIFIRPTEENARAAFAALRSLGAPLEGLDHTDLLVDYEHYKLVTEVNSVDVLTSIGGMPFDQVWSNRVTIQVEGVTAHLISKQDLIENKRQVGRGQDLVDAEELMRQTAPPPISLPDPPKA